MQNAILQEIHTRAEEISQQPIETLYFGGGTPSLWPVEDLDEIIQTIEQYTSLDSLKEVTLESNPDDLTPQYLSDLHHYSKVNRLSVGIQSFDDNDLRMMNRAHDSKEAHEALYQIFKTGFEEVTIDLIFGLPDLSIQKWENQLKTALQYPIGHISCYNLSIENKTALRHQIEKGIWTLPEDNLVADQYHLAHEILTKAGFIHYEISNYGKPDHLAIHNTSYWKNEPYIGIGPSAHSYDLYRRRWNVANNARYVRALKNEEIFWDEEILDEQDQYNEYLLTGLRTMWGVHDNRISQFSDKLRSTFYDQLKTEQKKNNVRTVNGSHTLTKQGQVLADQIISNFFSV